MAEKIASPDWSVDPVSDVLKWILLAVGIGTFGILGWTVKLTYQAAPPFPDRFVSVDGSVIMTANDVQAGKSGFQKADLMDYGSLYGMGSYFGEDYTASNLVRLATLTEDNLRRPLSARPSSPWRRLSNVLGYGCHAAQLHGVDLTQPVAVIPQEAAAAIETLQIRDRAISSRHDFAKGWTQAYSLDAASAAQTADFLIYSSLTTVARRPGTDISWTQNWPFEPLVGNAPTASTFAGPGSASASPFLPSAPSCSFMSAI